MPTPLNKELYEAVKREASQVYLKPSAYRSGWIVKTYKARGGTYKDDKKPKALKRWFMEKWTDVGGLEYPTYRPTKRISKDTPLTISEIDPANLREQAMLKQQYRGSRNLPPFKGGKFAPSYTPKV